MIRLLVLLPLCMIFFSGCSWSRERINISGFHDRAELVEPGITQATDLESIFGSPPNAIIPSSDGTIHLYNFGDAKTEGFNIFIVSFRKSNVGLDSALFFVGDDGVVSKKVISNNSKDLDWEFWPFGDG